MPDDITKLTPADYLNLSVGKAIQRAIEESLTLLEEGKELPPIEMGPYDLKDLLPIILTPPEMREGPTVPTRKVIEDGTPKPQRRQLVDVDLTESRRRKVIEWQVSNVSKLKSVPESKESKIRYTITKGIRQGWSKKQLIDTLQQKYKLSPHIAKLCAVNEIRRGNSWAFRKTAWELGYRNGIWRIHPGACPICVALNGRLIPLNVDSIPDWSHPFCRCYLKLSNVGYESPVKSAGLIIMRREIMAGLALA